MIQWTKHEKPIHLVTYQPLNPDPDAWKKYSSAEYSLLVQYLGFTPYFCVMADSLMSFTSNSIVAAPFLPEQNFCSKQTATPFWTL